MHFNAAIATAILASTAAASRKCGAPDPSDAHRAISAQFAKEEARNRASGRPNFAAASTNVNVYFHIVSATQAGVDAITDDVVSAQIDVMNEDYAPTGFSFTLKDTTRNVNKAWANDQAEIDMKTELRQGSYSDLNLYFQDQLQDDALGYCYFPTDASEGSQDFIIDGCSIAAATVPGGSAEGFNEGKTAVHESGHWFGLYHTFQGGCNGKGDEIDDTPAQSSPSSGCPTGRDSCPAEGLDPIHNYMDYSDDACYEEFTSGQVDRMKSFWSQYRG